MSVDAKTDGKTPKTESPSSSDVLGIPRIHAKNDESSVFTDNSAAGALKRERIFGTGADKKKKKIGAYFLGTMGKKTADALIVDDATKEQLDNLKDTVGAVSGALNATNLVGFGVMSVFAASSLKPDRLKPKADVDAPDAKARTTAPDTPDAKARVGTPDAPHSSSRVPNTKATASIAQEGAESSIKPLMNSVSKNALETGLDNALGAAKFLKRVPILGMGITAGFVAHEVFGFASKGDLNNAFAATVAGGAEITGNFLGFGAGDAARETVRAGFVAAGGEHFENVAKSDIRTWGETGWGLLKEHFNGAATQIETALTPIRTAAFNPAPSLNA